MGRYTSILLTVWGLYAGVQIMEPDPAQFFSGVLLLGTTIYATSVFRRARLLQVETGTA